MKQRIIVNLGQGNWQQGFPTVVVQLRETGRSAPIQLIGRLPAAPELATLYARWQSFYLAINTNLGLRQPPSNAVVEIEGEGVTHVSTAEFEALCQEIRLQFNNWLSVNSFINAERRLRTYLAPTSDAELIIEADDPFVRRFPWHLWHLLEDYPHVEVAIGTLEYRTAPNRAHKPHGHIRMLSVLGDSTGIQVERDQDVLNQLPGVKAILLDEPPKAELTQQLWDTAGWDILFFAGHSFTQSGDTAGYLQINATESLSISQLKYSLKKAIKQGLQLAIFNSCDGMGIAWELSGLDVPYLIVMREPVPDQVAQTFLMDFLTMLSSGTPFSLAVREAREKLEGLESTFPGASWLPVICQNPAAPALTWQTLQGHLIPTPAEPQRTIDDISRNVATAAPKVQKQLGRRRSLQKVLLAATLAMLTVMGIRWTGLLEPLELSAYDFMMRSRPAEAVDENILIIKVTPDDLQEHGPIRISDPSLTRLIDELEKYQPSSIGIDMHRADPTDSREDHRALFERFEQYSNLYTVCHFGATSQSFRTPDQLLEMGLTDQLGFSDFEADGIKPNHIIRRHLTAYSNPESVNISNSCSDFSLSLQLAAKFLGDKGIEPIGFFPHLQLGPMAFRRLSRGQFGRFAGYQRLEMQEQIMLNYRALEDNQSAFQTTTLKDFFAQDVDPKFIRNKIVLVGVTSEVQSDLHRTPYGVMYGVEIHAHMVSQLVYGALEGRTPIWDLPDWRFVQWGDALWVWVWSLLSAITVWVFRLRIKGIIFTIFISSAIVYMVCFGTFAQGGWMPLLPTLLSIMMTDSMLIIFRSFLSRHA